MQEVNSTPRDRLSALTKDLRFLSPARRYFPQRSYLVVVDPLVCRLERSTAALSRDLQCHTARGRDFPDLTGSRAVRCEINPLPIVRPTRSSVRRTSPGNVPGHTSAKSDRKN